MVQQIISIDFTRHNREELNIFNTSNSGAQKRITNRQRLLTFYCLFPFNLTLRPGLIMSKTSDDSSLAARNKQRAIKHERFIFTLYI